MVVVRETLEKTETLKKRRLLERRRGRVGKGVRPASLELEASERALILGSPPLPCISSLVAGETMSCEAEDSAQLATS